ncbi:MAG: ABC transporter permease subunit, partial [Alphaproteobacteria bacterium]|nr:ABC transporter permease subunit [Alphaproteobacteria bacterium]
MLANIFGDIVLLAKPALYNLYFSFASIPLGFLLALLLAIAKNHSSRGLSVPAKTFIYAFRGSPLFIQFFMIYSLMLAFNIDYWVPWGIDWLVMSPLFIGPAVLILNTTAYSAEIFYGAIRAVPKGEIEAAEAYGMT